MKVINEAIDLVLMWLDDNVVAEQHEFEYYRTTLSNVFDPFMGNMINDVGNCMQLGTDINEANDVVNEEIDVQQGTDVNVEICVQQGTDVYEEIDVQQGTDVYEEICVQQSTNVYEEIDVEQVH
ncbi:hypothetical protein P8452_50696 [Trifolium repens]|nr:hypothetical protein P8452_50696 [Trifolium repens]